MGNEETHGQNDENRWKRMKMKRSEGKQTGKQKIEESEDKTMKKVWTSKKTE